MSIYLRDDTRVTVWEIEEVKEGIYSVKFSSGRKDKRTGKYINTNWSFVKFIGPAGKKAKDLQPKDRIVLLNAWISREPYEKDGETLYPKNVAMTVYDFEFYKKADVNREDEPPTVEEVDEDEFPF